MKAITKIATLVAALFVSFDASYAQPPALQHVQPYEARGRNGWMLNQKLSFGPYQTGKIKRSWTSAPSFEFVVRLAKAKQKFHFAMTDNQGHTSEVFMSGELKRKELPLFDGSMSLMLPDEDLFVGTIFVNEDEQPWEFYLENPNKETVLEIVSGKLTKGSETIVIEESKYISGGKKHLGGQALAYQFVQNGRIIGAVEVVNKGKVYLDDSLSEAQQFVLANAAAALMLRENLMEAVE